MNMKTWNVYCSGEIHTNWRKLLSSMVKAEQLPIELTSPNCNHEESDAVGDILNEADPEHFQGNHLHESEYRRKVHAHGMRSPKFTQKNRIGSFYAHSDRGTVDQVDEILRGGPQPDFYESEVERKMILKERLAEIAKDSVADKDLRRIAGEYDKAHTRTYSSHLHGAGGIVNGEISHAGEKTRTLQELIADPDTEQTPAEWALFHARDTVGSAFVDHLAGAANIPMTPNANYVFSTEAKDRRCKDVPRTERMILARLAGSGSIPALKSALQKTDVTRSGVLSEDEFLAMINA